MEGKTEAEQVSLFVSKHKEKATLNQYWYSPKTIEVIVKVRSTASPQSGAGPKVLHAELLNSLLGSSRSTYSEFRSPKLGNPLC